ncbi:glycosyl hydrolase family 61-domain-containing protein [Cladorrhinum sp. PSN259]|nr:glycosyl hydrolase family 61-domain-containing protein [Cladorrhinum sp. PSN259]
MKTFLAGLLGVLLAPVALGHNIHGIILVNGTETTEWQYVLDVAGVVSPSGPDGYQGFKLDPIIGSDNPNVTCGRLAFNSAPRTETADILAGSEVGFRVSADGYGNRQGPYSYGEPHFWHAGPGIIYLSRAPNDDLANYKGDGDWFKIAYAGPLNDTTWSLWPSVSDFNFTIPKTTPPGKYLMRIENFMPTARLGYLQFYVNCAFVNIMGPGGGTPTEFVRFPGTYKDDDPGFLVPDDQESLGGLVSREDLKLMNYKPPGPAVWTG